MGFSFVWDDLANFNTLSHMALSDVIKPSPKIISLSSLFASNWRPLTNGLFVFFGNFTPFFAHFVNLLFFSLSVGVLSLLIFELTKNTASSLTFSLTFSLHPASVESAVWPSSFSLYILPSLLSVYLALKNRKSLSAVFYSAALLFKESALAVFPVLFFITGGKGKVVYTAITASYLILRQFAVGVIPYEQKPHYDINTLRDMLLGLGFYVKSTFFPYPFRVYTPDVPKDFWVILFLIIGIIASFFLFLRFRETGVWVILFFSNLLLHLLVVGFERAPSVLSYRYMALSLAALVIILALVFKERGQIFFLPVLGISSVFSFNVMDIWRDNFNFWEKAYDNNPDDPTVLLNYGSTLLSRGDTLGLNLMWKIIKGNYENEDKFDAGVNIMAYHFNKGDFERCLEFSDKIRSLGENDLYYYLKTLCALNVGDTLGAKESIKEGITKYPHRPELLDLAKKLGVI
ncbi:MAG: hypothetical protein ABIL16_05765 [candidate division WOR-3 bacterium]